MPRLFGVFLLLTLANCDKTQNASDAPKAASPSAAAVTSIVPGEWGAPTINVCAILPREEVAQIQESQITKVASMGRPDGDFLVSQCIYTANPEHMSVVATVTRSNPAIAGKPPLHEFWRQTFARAEERDHATKEGNEQSQPEGAPDRAAEKEFVAPKKLEALGEDAYWMGGAVYVLKNELILRVSVGGRESEERKIEKSRTLADSALRRLFPQRP